MITKQSGDMVMNNTNDAYTLLTIISGVLVVGGWVLVGILGALVMIALTPPRTKKELLGMVASSFGSSLFIGPLIIEAYGLTHYSFQSQLGICFMCAAPAWLLWGVVRTIIQKWRDSKDPVGKISRDVKRIKSWWM
jgi:predicted permease